MRSLKTIILLAFCSAIATFAFAQDAVLPGTGGSKAGGSGSGRWCSAWWDLPAPTQFTSGEIVCVSVLAPVGHNVLVRLLHKEHDPEDPAGIVGGVRQVPQNSVIPVPLTKAYTDIRQVSVHGCSAAFGIALPNEAVNDTLLIAGVSVVQDQSQCK